MTSSQRKIIKPFPIRSWTILAMALLDLARPMMMAWPGIVQSTSLIPYCLRTGSVTKPVHGSTFGSSP